MWSLCLCFGLLSAFALVGFILTIVFKEKIYDGSDESVSAFVALVLFTTVSFIAFSIMCLFTYRTNEEVYGDCMKNVNQASYCIKYLGE